MRAYTDYWHGSPYDHRSSFIPKLLFVKTSFVEKHKEEKATYVIFIGLILRKKKRRAREYVS